MTHSSQALRPIDIGAATLSLRPAVEVRERTVGNETGFYLSIYSDEIDDRAEAFWTAWQQNSLDEVPRQLELTDAFFWVGPADALTVGRGGAATFPLYWRADKGLEFSTALPVHAGGAFSRAGMVSAVAAACLHSSYEPNAFIETPLAGWRRVRRGSFLRFERRRVLDERQIPPRSQAMALEVMTREVRAAFDAYSRSQRHVVASVLEVSGGFDSTLAAAVLSRTAMSGVSVTFPYYEFRFEDALQQATADFLGISRIALDGTTLLPYSSSEAPVRFDEPSVFVTGTKHAESVGRFAAERAATRIYVGHGGDQCFSTDLTVREQLVVTPLTRGPFTPPAWRVVKRAIDEIASSPWTDRRLGTFVYDARPDVWIKETFGATPRTPFSDLRVFETALAWSTWCADRGVRPSKTILAEAAADLLPAAVIDRRGKVAYDGVWRRGYRQHADHLLDVFEKARDVFDHIGVSVDWLQRRARDLGAWAEASDREVLGLFAVAAWLTAWGLERAADVDWAD